MAARVVGIDLGTTNTIVAWAEVGGASPVHVFPIPQLVTAGETEARPLFPSCLYAPLPGEVTADPFLDAPYATGEFARRRGSEVPGRLVASAKSWLCHAGVDRTAAILPWGAEEASDLPRISPIDASARYLAHVRQTWNDAFPDVPLEAQDVILTVPASFDEVARELTVEAASRAGLPMRLLEEPQAAFYDYMHRAGNAGIEAFLARNEGAEQLVLICDVGGGTTDLSLIRVVRASGPVPFEVSRVAVGHHLLLGGDNMDLALAILCESRMETRFDPARFGQLVSACRVAKEKLLSDDAPVDVPVTVLGSGSSLVGSARTARLTREDCERIVVDGFFPVVPRDARPTRARGGLVAFGLPYEKDAGITRHVASFFARHAPPGAHPTALLLNGGVFHAPRIVARLTEVVDGWRPETSRPLEILPNREPDLGVARGAVAYGLALRGHGVRIQGGASRGYYVALDSRQSESRRAVCVVPRGAPEGVPQMAAGRTLALTVGRAVRFDLFTSDDARVDRPGDVVMLDGDHFQALPPVATSFRAGDELTEIRVALEGELTAVGTLDLACVEVDHAPNAQPRRFALAFQLRPTSEGLPSLVPTRPPPPSRGQRSDLALDAIDRVFGKPRPDAAAREVKDLVRELERHLGDRATWTMALSRTLFDALSPLGRARRRSPDHERVFWMLAGFSIRPGFGDPLDVARASSLAELFDEKLAFPDNARGWQQFWIAWRRAAAGLDEITQLRIRDAADPFLAPASSGLKKPKKARYEALDDMLEMTSTLERVPPARKSELGGWILERTWTDRDPRLWTALSRLGARIPAYASVHHVVSPLIAERWLDHLLREKWELVPTAVASAVSLARVTGDRARDVSERVRLEVARRLGQIAASEEAIRSVREHVPMKEAERAAFFGEGLPVGLRLVDNA
jgi:molecular chaperone DnaK (HSP70)